MEHIHHLTEPTHDKWSSRLAFVLAATGAAVGLGNIWKFPYIAGENGGSAFVLLYLVCIAAIGLPLMMTEILIGRRGRHNPAGAMTELAVESRSSKHWKWLGVMIILSGFLILSYYGVIAGWALDYVFKAAFGDFTNSNAQLANAQFDQLLASPSRLIFWQSLIMLTTIVVVGLGVRRGIENSVRYMFPIMLSILMLLIFYSVEKGSFMPAVHFLFDADFSKLTAKGGLIALGHAFFTLSLATGSIMVYGSYLPHNMSITKASVLIAATDTAVALLAGLAIFPIVFANNLSPDAGAGLLFKTLPLAFGQMPHGSLFATLFFLMLVLAAFTSTISLLEPSVAWIIQNTKLSRFKATLMAGLIIWFLGLGTVFSFNHWANLKIFGLDFFNGLDYLTANIMLPLGGLLLAIFGGWLLRKEVILDELNMKDGILFKSWQFCMRYFIPLAIILIFLNFFEII